MSNWKKARLLCRKTKQSQFREKAYDKLADKITHLFFVDDTPKADFVIVVGEETMKEQAEEIILAQKLEKPIIYTDENMSFSRGQLLEMTFNDDMDMEHNYELGGR